MKVVRPGTGPRGGGAQTQGPWWKVQVSPTVALVAVVVVVLLIYGIHWFTHRGGAAGLKMVEISEEERMKVLPPDVQQDLREHRIDWSEIPPQALVKPMQGSQAAQAQAAQGAQRPRAPR